MRGRLKDVRFETLQISKKNSISILFILTLIIVVHLAIFCQKHVPPGGDTVGHILEVFFATKGDIENVFTAYRPYYIPISFIAQSTGIPLHSALLSFSLFLYIVFFLIICFFSNLLYLNWNASIYAVALGLLSISPYHFLKGPTSHLWAVSISGIVVCYVLLFDRLKDIARSSTFICLFYCFILTIIQVSYISLWIVLLPVICLYIISKKSTENIIRDGKLALYGGILSLILSSKQYIDLFLKSNEFSLFLSPGIIVLYVIGVFSLFLIIIPFVISQHGFTANILESITTSKKLPIIYMVACLSILYYLIVSKFIPIPYFSEFLRYEKIGKVVSLLSIPGAFIISYNRKYKNIRWIFTWLFYLMLLYIVSIVLFSLTGHQIFFRIEKTVLIAQGAFVLPIILCCLPVINYIYGSSGKKIQHTYVVTVLLASFLVLGARASHNLLKSSGIANWVERIESKHLINSGWSIGKLNDIQLALWTNDKIIDKSDYVLNFGGYYSNWFVLSGLEIVFKRQELHKIDNEAEVLKLLKEFQNGNYHITPNLLDYNIKYVYIASNYNFVPVNPYLTQIMNHNGAQLYKINRSSRRIIDIFDVNLIEKAKKNGSSYDIKVMRPNNKDRFRKIRTSNNGNVTYLETEPVMVFENSIDIPLENIGNLNNAIQIRVSANTGRFGFQMIQNDEIIGRSLLNSKQRGIHIVELFYHKNGPGNTILRIIPKSRMQFWGVEIAAMPKLETKI